MRTTEIESLELSKTKHAENFTHEYPKVGVFGLGYVGSVTGACLANAHFKVIGMDPDPSKCEKINAGKAPMAEPGLDDLIEQSNRRKILTTSLKTDDVVSQTDVSIVCVGTPSGEDGSCDLRYLKTVCQQIGEQLRRQDDYHVIVFRSTIPPGSTRKHLIPILEKESHKTCGRGFGVCFHPEFLREGTAIDDFGAPPKTVIGAFDAKSAKPLEEIYRTLNNDVIHTSLEVAEMVKYVDNSWHAVKVSFGNEIGRLSQALDIDSHVVMDIFIQDTKLNISPYYLIPGAAFGGSCLPKDLRGINHLAETNDVDLPMLSHVLRSNKAQIDHTIDLIKNSNQEGEVIGFLGVTFKPDTDDLRESPILQIMANLTAEGYDVRFYDPNMDLSGAVAHQLEHTKHESKEFRDFIKAIGKHKVDSAMELAVLGQVLVVSHNTKEFEEVIRHRTPGKQVIDLVRILKKDDMWPLMSNAGVNDFVAKPASLSQLLETVLKWTPNKAHPSVLLAEDEEVVAKATRLMLEKSGFVVKQAGDGKQVMDALNEDSFDLILMDLKMPTQDGIETTKAIRRLSGEKAHIPILAFSRYTRAEKSSSYSGIAW